MPGRALTAANRMNHFDLIAFGQNCRLMLAARHDIQVQLHRHPTSDKLQTAQQRRDGFAIGQLKGFTVQLNAHATAAIILRGPHSSPISRDDQGKAAPFVSGAVPASSHSAAQTPGSQPKQRPANEERQPAERRDYSQLAEAGQGQHVEAARKQHDAQGK